MEMSYSDGIDIWRQTSRVNQPTSTKGYLVYGLYVVFYIYLDSYIRNLAKCNIHKKNIKYKKGRYGMIANETTLHKRPKWHRNL